VGPQVSGSGSLSVLMPSPYNVIGASGVQAAIGALDDVYKPGVHGAIIVKLARHFMIGDDITYGISNIQHGISNV
jgi:hypothetical protein